MMSKDVWIVCAIVILALMGGKIFDAWEGRNDEPIVNHELEQYKKEQRLIDSLATYYTGIQDSLSLVIDNRNVKIDSLESDVTEAMDKIRVLTKINVTNESKKKAKLWIEEHNRSLSH